MTVRLMTVTFPVMMIMMMTLGPFWETCGTPLEHMRPPPDISGSPLGHLWVTSGTCQSHLYGGRAKQQQRKSKTPVGQLWDNVDDDADNDDDDDDDGDDDHQHHVAHDDHDDDDVDADDHS
eukprot:691950-Karenia_brevis.AAC.1